MAITDFCSIASIPNLFIELTINLKDFLVYPGLTKEQLTGDYKIDLNIMNYVERENWVSSPIYIRRFSVPEAPVGKEQEFAFTTASKHMEDFINTLILFKPSIAFLSRGPFWVLEEIGGKVSGTGKGDFSVVPKLAITEKYDLQSSEYSDFSKFFDVCYPYFSAGIKSDLDKSISNAYYWLTKVRINLQPYDRLIFLITALESLVGAGTELTHRISHRTATALGKDSIERGKIYDKISDYYGQRSTLLHGRKEIISNAQLYDLAEMVRVMILRFASLSLNSYETTHNGLMKKLDRAVVDDILRNEIIKISRESFTSRSDPQLKLS
ncbi:MAG: hypothetical protein WD033_01850 [Nitrosopumilaceae archaeon]